VIGDHPTISRLAAYLAARCTARQARGRIVPGTGSL
jgi:hypothetical protein